MTIINTFIFIKEPQLEQKVIECLHRFKSINIIDRADNNADFVESYRYHFCQLLIVDLTYDYQNTLDVIGLVNKPVMTLGIIAQPELTYHLLNKDITDVIVDKFSIDIFIKKIGKIKRTIELTIRGGGNFTAAEEKIQYRGKEEEQTFCFLKQERSSIRVEYKDILYARSSGRLIEVRTRRGEKYFHNSSLKGFLNILPPDQFVRVNNSVIVNILHIDKVEKFKVSIKEYSFQLTRIYSGHVKNVLGI